MRLPRWEPWVHQALADSGGFTRVQSFTDAGITDKRFGQMLTVPGARFSVHWLRTSASGGEDQSQPEEPVTGEPPAPVKLPASPSSGRVRPHAVEEYVAAVIANGATPEIREVKRMSTRPDSPQSCGVIISMHSGADVFGLIRPAPAAG